MDKELSQDSATDEQLAADEAAAEAAFASGFNDEAHQAPPQADKAEPQGKAEEAAAEPETKPAAPAPAAPAPAPAPVVADPYATLPEDVREKLARIPDLEHRANSDAARVAALNRALEEARAKLKAAEPAPAPQKIAAVEKIREEGLPEVADAIEAAFNAALTPKKDEPAAANPPAAAAPAPAQEAADPELTYLQDLHPDWAPKMNSTDFRLWLGNQDAKFRDEVLSTDKAIVVAAALTKFDKFRSEVAAAAEAAAHVGDRRRERVAAGVRPEGGRKPSARSAPLTEDEAFEEGFNSP